MIPNPPSLYFSIFGGFIFEADIEEEKVLDAFQLPMKQLPKSSCNKCKGRFHIGYSVQQRHFIICSKCARKCIDADKLLARKNASVKKNH